MTAYERDEKRTRMRMNKIMGWNIWREHKEEQREGIGGEKNAKHLLWSACNEGYMSPNQQLRDTTANCRARASTLKVFNTCPCTAVCVVEAVSSVLSLYDAQCFCVFRHHSIYNSLEAIQTSFKLSSAHVSSYCSSHNLHLLCQRNEYKSVSHSLKEKMGCFLF